MAKFYEVRIGEGTKNRLNGGIRLAEETSLSLSQSPYGGLLNMMLNEGGTLVKRNGQSYLFDTSLGSGAINGMFSYKDKLIIAHGTKLYSQVDTEQPVSIYSGVANAKTNFFVYNNILYILNGEQYLQYDGTTVKSVDPYKPQVSINRKPDGSSSSTNESWNMLGRGFVDSFNGDGVTKIYKLSLKDLDADKVTCNVGGTEGNGFTVDRVEGTVTFSTAPAEGTNNIKITAFKTFYGLADNILKCTFACEFSNRIFISGNPNLPNYYFAGGLTESVDATYFPQKYQYQVSGTDKSVTGFKVHYNKLLVFKEDMIALVEAATGLDNTASFPIQFLNTENGCDMPGSIQLIANTVIFANTYGGVFVISSTMIPGEKSVLPISYNINGTVEFPGLLYQSKTELTACCSVDYDYKYYLVVGDNAYVFDYREGIHTDNPKGNTFFIYDNIKATCFVVQNNEIIYGHNSIGKLVKFTQAKNDFGLPINAIWKSKVMDFDTPDYLKMIKFLWVTFRNSSATSSIISANYINEIGEKIQDIIVAGNNQYSWKTFSWSDFSWEIKVFDKTIRQRIKAKKIVYFQLEFKNNTLNEDLEIKNIVLSYRLLRKVR